MVPRNMAKKLWTRKPHLKKFRAKSPILKQVAEEPQHDWEKRYKDLEQSHSRRGNEVHKYKKELDDLRFQKLEMQQKLLELEQLKKSSANESDNNTDDPYSDENYWTDAEKEILKEYPEIVGVAEKFAKRESLLAERRLQDAKPSYTDKIEKLEEKIEEQTRYISRQQAFARLDELVGPVWREVDEDPDFHQYVNDSKSGARLWITEIWKRGLRYSKTFWKSEK